MKFKPRTNVIRASGLRGWLNWLFSLEDEELEKVDSKADNEIDKARLLRAYDRVIKDIEGAMTFGVEPTFAVLLTAAEGEMVAAALREAKGAAEKIETTPQTDTATGK